MGNTFKLGTAPQVSTNYIPKSSSNSFVNSLIWDNGTNVGIGNTNTTYTFDVTGTINSSSTISINATNNAMLFLNRSSTAQYGWLRYGTAGTYYWRVGLQSDSTNNFSIADDTSAAKLTVTTAGNVGIGTNSPFTTLDVKQSSTGSASPTVAFRDSSTNGNALQIWNGNNEARFRAVYYGATPSDQNITFYTITAGGNEAERLRLTSGGTLSYTNTPLLNYHIATDNGKISVANGGTVNFANFSGLIVVNNHLNGYTGIFLCGAGTTSLVSYTGSTSGLGTLSYSSGIDGYVWTSNYGATAFYGFFAVKTRNGA